MQVDQNNCSKCRTTKIGRLKDITMGLETHWKTRARRLNISVCQCVLRAQSVLLLGSAPPPPRGPPPPPPYNEQQGTSVGAEALLNVAQISPRKAPLPPGRPLPSHTASYPLIIFPLSEGGWEGGRFTRKFSNGVPSHKPRAGGRPFLTPRAISTRYTR